MRFYRFKLPHLDTSGIKQRHMHDFRRIENKIENNLKYYNSNGKISVFKKES